ncbi:MAG: acetate--CoA ligase family protein [Deltaproteobacteria bacterium]|nr:acetate--CoA ligase family protein [Deltaproteobacteria bacterium]
MARLYEHQGKVLLRTHGVPVPAGRVAATPDEAEAIARELGRPVVVKAQVLSGRRGRRGGVRAAETPEAAAEAARDLLGRSLDGLAVERVLVEEQVPHSQELYVAITADPARRMPAVIFSPRGGIEIEEAAREAPDQVFMDHVNIFQPYHAYRAVGLLKGADGPAGEPLAQGAAVLEALYTIFRRYDAKLVEVNPLAVTPRGVVALDARVDIDDDAIYRQPALGLQATEEAGERPPTKLELAAGTIDEEDHRGSAHFVQIDPDGSYAQGLGKIPVAFDSVGTGASLTLMDELVPLGYYPVNFCDTSGGPAASKLYRITKILLSQPQIRGYIFASCVATQRLDENMRGVGKAFRELYPGTGGHPNLPCLFVLRGAYDQDAIAVLEALGLASAPLVRILGRETTERDAARAFDALYRSWETTR